MESHQCQGMASAVHGTRLTQAESLGWKKNVLLVLFCFVFVLESTLESWHWFSHPEFSLWAPGTLLGTNQFSKCMMLCRRDCCPLGHAGRNLREKGCPPVPSADITATGNIPFLVKLKADRCKNEVQRILLQFFIAIRSFQASCVNDDSLTSKCLQFRGQSLAVWIWLGLRKKCWHFRGWSAAIHSSQGSKVVGLWSRSLYPSPREKQNEDSLMEETLVCLRLLNLQLNQRRTQFEMPK